VSFDDGVITLNVRGCLDLPLGLELWEAARPFLFNAHHLVINLRDLTQICASGFTWLIMVQGKTQALGMTLAYADVPDRYDSRLRLVTGST
jgi:ABC-type transporter Mla MlaB component